MIIYVLIPFLLQQGDPAAEKLFQEEIKNICTAYPSELLDFHSVRNLRDRKDHPYLKHPETRRLHLARNGSRVT